MSAGTLERTSTDSAEGKGNRPVEKDDMVRFMAHVVGKDGLQGDSEYTGTLLGRKPRRRLVSAAPPEGKPRPSGREVDEFLGDIEAELRTNTETLGGIALDTELAAAVHGGQLVLNHEEQLAMADA